MTCVGPQGSLISGPTNDVTNLGSFHDFVNEDGKNNLWTISFVVFEELPFSVSFKSSLLNKHIETLARFFADDFTTIIQISFNSTS